MKDVVIVAARRTAIGSFQGGLAKVPAVELGATVIRALLDDTQLAPELVDEVLLGQVLTAGAGQNPARQAALAAGLPQTVPAMTLNKVCGSGLAAVQLAARAIASGEANIVIAGGQENMSLAPYVLPQVRTGLRMGHGQVIDTMIQDGLWCAFNDYHMGITAENLAQQFAISREQQDAFAEHSHAKAIAAQKAGHFQQEIVPVTVVDKRGSQSIVEQDEQPRAGTTAESLARLRPAFAAQGSVTAGNASSLNDGAAAVMLMRREQAQALNLPILARVAGQGAAGVDPAIMGIGPVAATQQCLKKAGWEVADLDVIEANEAFAVQALAVERALGWDPKRVNPNGGAIALGHPIGASGCRILVTLLYQMQRQQARKGLATLCIGGGQGVALALER
mgnify:FL=1